MDSSVGDMYIKPGPRPTQARHAALFFVGVFLRQPEDIDEMWKCGSSSSGTMAKVVVVIVVDVIIALFIPHD